MNPVLKAKWVAALRSGKYPQARGRLFEMCSSEDGEDVPHYCCLAVLGAVYGLDMPDYASSTSDNGVRLALKHDISRYQAEHLMRMNDYLRADFAKIADYVEEHL